MSDELSAVPEDEQHDPRRSDLPEPLRTGTLSAQEEKAIIALLHDPGLTAAAKEAGIGKTTLWEWLKRPHFREAYRAARREALSRAIASIQQAASEAAQCLRDVMGDEGAPHQARVSAAKIVLDKAFEAAELEDLGARVDALEARTDASARKAA